MSRPNILFVCSKQQWRSPTAEAIYRNDDRVSVRSRGSAKTAVQTIRSSDIAWADAILVMEDKHRQGILADFPGESKFKAMHVLDIPDDYRFMDDELIVLICSAVEHSKPDDIQHFGSAHSGGCHFVLADGSTRLISPAEILRQVVDILVGGEKKPDRRDVLDELLHMISCKAAIKAGDRLSVEEVDALLEQRHLFHDTHHCPHGRPTALVFTREELDKRFKRI